jgi:glyoxalase/bleomycin resistance protein/dioxygenase superfamily protein
MDDPGLGTLDYIYASSRDVAADARWFVDVLGAELVFAIDDGGTRVAMVRLGSDSTPLLVTDHLPDDRPVLLYRVASLDDVSKRLRDRGWTPERTIELPMGPATTFQSPGGVRLAIYEASRPFVVQGMTGRRDF